MNALALTLVVAAVAPAETVPAPAPTRLLVLDLKSESLPPEVMKALRDEVTLELGRDPQLAVLSSEDLRNAVDLDASRAVAGCDVASCLAEVGAALGARHVVYGSAVVVGGSRVVYLNLFDSDNGSVVARAAVEAADDAGLRQAARGAARQIGDAVHPGVVDGAGSSPFFVAGLATGAAGVVAAGAGLVVAVVAAGTVNDLSKDGPSVEERQGAQTAGAVATVVAVVGAAAAVAGAGLAVWGME